MNFLVFLCIVFQFKMSKPQTGATARPPAPKPPKEAVGKMTEPPLTTKMIRKEFSLPDNEELYDDYGCTMKSQGAAGVIGQAV